MKSYINCTKKIGIINNKNDKILSLKNVMKMKMKIKILKKHQLIKVTLNNNG